MLNSYKIFNVRNFGGNFFYLVVAFFAVMGLRFHFALFFNIFDIKPMMVIVSLVLFVMYAYIRWHLYEDKNSNFFNIRLYVSMFLVVILAILSVYCNGPLFILINTLPLYYLLEIDFILTTCAITALNTIVKFGNYTYIHFLAEGLINVKYLLNNIFINNIGHISDNINRPVKLSPDMWTMGVNAFAAIIVGDTINVPEGFLIRDIRSNPDLYSTRAIRRFIGTYPDITIQMIYQEGTVNTYPVSFNSQDGQPMIMLEAETETGYFMTPDECRLNLESYSIIRSGVLINPYTNVLHKFSPLDVNRLPITFSDSDSLDAAFEPLIRAEEENIKQHLWNTLALNSYMNANRTCVSTAESNGALTVASAPSQVSQAVQDTYNLAAQQKSLPTAGSSYTRSLWLLYKLDEATVNNPFPVDWDGSKRMRINNIIFAAKACVKGSGDVWTGRLLPDWTRN